MTKTKAKTGSARIVRNNKAVTSHRYFNLIGMGIVILLGIIIYSNSFNCGFIFDDKTAIVENPVIKTFDIKNIWNYGHNRFIPNLTFAINYQNSKLDLGGFHLYNLEVHLLNALLVWWLTFLVLSAPAMKNHTANKHKHWIALTAAMLFVSHPLATQSVTYIVQRIAAMAALFYFLSVALYMKGRLADKKSLSSYFFFVGSFIAGCFALMSKENTYTLPFAIVLTEVLIFQDKKVKINLKDYRVLGVLIFIAAFLYFVVNKFSLNILNPIPASYYNDYRTITWQAFLLTEFSVLVKYIQLLFIPINQNFDYDYPLSTGFFEMRTLLSFAVLLGLLVLVIVFYKKNRLFSFAILWFFVTSAIESSFIPISDVINEHRTYLPSLGFFIALSTGVFVLLGDKNKNVAIGLFAFIIVCNSFLTFQRNKVYLDGVSFWSDCIDKSPNKARCYSERGIVYFHDGKDEEALKDFNKAIELKPMDSKAFNARGGVLGKKKQFEDAIKDFDKAIELNPKYPNAYFNRGLTKMKIGQKESACLDMKKSSALGYGQATSFCKQYCK